MFMIIDWTGHGRFQDKEFVSEHEAKRYLQYILGGQYWTERNDFSIALRADFRD